MQSFTSTTDGSFGFFGTLQSNYGVSFREATRLFQSTGEAMVLAGLPVDEVVGFLDSRYGRHFADALDAHLPKGIDLRLVDPDQIVAAVAAELGKSAARWIRAWQKANR